MNDGSRNRRFEQMVLPHLQPAYELARWLAGNDNDAEDVVQEACVRAFRFFDDWRGESARAWLLAIVRNTAFNWLERNRPKHVVSMATEDLEAAGDAAALRHGDSTDPEQAVLAIEQRSALTCALDSLPPVFREVIVLRELQDLSYREIAEITGVPEGTVMSRLARARGELRRRWRKSAP